MIWLFLVNLWRVSLVALLLLIAIGLKVATDQQREILFVLNGGCLP